MKGNEPPRLDAVVDLVGRQAESHEQLASDDSMLRCGQSRDRGVDPWGFGYLKAIIAVN